MSDQIITSDLLVDLSTEEQQVISGGIYGFYRRPFIGRPFIGRPFIGRPFIGRPFIGRRFSRRRFY
ncbi:MAG: hypothetical protein V7K68_30555 [Nostoc sp.]|uniref:hypothetical protein n=1 Tax=Nostoc sp. TaxID=1180 RepID=UPI002FF8B252